MKSIKPAELMSFIAIANHLSLSKAAVELGVSPSALSHTLRGMEDRLGLRLFNRTTRSVALTAAGERLYARIRPAFRDIDDALEDLNDFRGKPSGSLRFTAALTSARLALLPLAARFVAEYPQVSIEIVADDSLVDMVSSGFDAGVRFGESIDADMVAVPLGPRIRSAVVATPEYFEQQAIPRTPHDLRHMPCIRQRFPSGALYRWEFERGGVALDVQVEGPLTLGTMELCVDAALTGAGMAFVFAGLVEPAIAAGRLVRVLEDWCPYHPGLFLYYPSRRQLPAALKAFIEFSRTTPVDGIAPVR